MLASSNAKSFSNKHFDKALNWLFFQIREIVSVEKLGDNHINVTGTLNAASSVKSFKLAKTQDS